MKQKRKPISSKILSLGAGMQSSTLFMMACFNEIERFDAAIFADTGWEPKPVYRWLEFLKEQGKKHRIPIHIVRQGNIREDALNSQVRPRKGQGRRHASMPLFVLGPNGERGIIRRQCTYEYKIRPITRKQRKLVGYLPYKRIPPGSIECWKGISVDEAQRVTISDKPWMTFHYPLIEMEMSRQDCLNWFKKRKLPTPPRSACIGCPFRRDTEWIWLKENSPEDFKDAFYIDKIIRKCGGMRGDLFLHEERKPLDEIIFKNETQLNLFDSECAGICGV